MGPIFKDREEAGILLAEKLAKKGIKNGLVLAIPRGGVVIGKEISQKLDLPLDIIVVKKVGSPYDPELAIGAVGPSDSIFWEEEICQRLGIDKNRQKKLLKTYCFLQKKKEDQLSPKKITLLGKTVILTDDGIATGATVLAGIKYLKKKKVGKIIVATPVISLDNLEKMRNKVDELVYLEAPIDFWAVGQFYREFPQVEDEEVIRILKSKNKNAKKSKA